MNCIFTINLGNFMCDNARASMVAAASRWSVDYVEVCGTDHPERYPGYMKVMAANCNLSGYNRVCYLDADCVVRSDAPNIFEQLHDPELFYAVTDRTESWPENEASLKEQCERLHIVDCRVSIYTFFNAGFFLCTPGLWTNLFSYVIHQSPNDDKGPPEQAMLNIAASIYGHGNVKLVSPEWNDCGDWSQPMRSYVYHFAGPYKSLAQQQNWKV